jgi:hypothetical protein
VQHVPPAVNTVDINTISANMAATNSINSDTRTESLGASPPSACHFLRLSAELRNRIYELAFAPDDEVVDLLDIKPAHYSLLLTSSQISAEAKGIYATARPVYWSETRFKIETDDTKKPKGMANLSSTADLDLKLIQSLVMRIPCNGHLAGGARLGPLPIGEAEWHSCGGWHVRCRGREYAVILYQKKKGRRIKMYSERLSMSEDFANQVRRMIISRRFAPGAEYMSMRNQVAWFWKNL